MQMRMQMQIIQTDTLLTISQSTEAIHLDLQYLFVYFLANILANRNRQLRYLTESQRISLIQKSTNSFKYLLQRILTP